MEFFHRQQVKTKEARIRPQKNTKAMNKVDAASLHEQRLLDHPSHLIRRAYQISSALFENEFQTVNLTPGQWSVIVTVFTFPGIDQTEIAHATAQDKTSAARAIRSLVEREILSVNIPAEDGRRRRLTLTGQGHKLREEAMNVSDKLAAVILKILPKESRQQFTSMLQEFVLSGDHLSRAKFKKPDPNRL